MEKIIEMRDSLRKSMRTYLEGIVNENVIGKLDTMSTDDMYNICMSLQDLKTVASKAKKYIAYTDGGYSMENKIGAGAFVILSDEIEFKRGGVKVVNSTNNVAEITAIECALKEIPRDSEVTIRSDSQYAIGVLSGKWKAKTNTSLIEEVKNLIKRQNLTVNYEWVRGHSGNKYNEVCDNLCDEIAGCDLNAEYAKYKK